MDFHIRPYLLCHFRIGVKRRCPFRNVYFRYVLRVPRNAFLGHTVESGEDLTDCLIHLQ